MASDSNWALFLNWIGEYNSVTPNWVKIILRKIIFIAIFVVITSTYVAVLLSLNWENHTHGFNHPELLMDFTAPFPFFDTFLHPTLIECFGAGMAYYHARHRSLGKAGSSKSHHLPKQTFSLFIRAMKLRVFPQSVSNKFVQWNSV